MQKNDSHRPEDHGNSVPQNNKGTLDKNLESPELIDPDRGFKKSNQEPYIVSKDEERAESTSTANPFTWIQTLFGAIALITAALFLISWIYNRRYFGEMGLHGYTIRYTTQDYILNAKSVISVGIFIILILGFLFVNPKLNTRKYRKSIVLFGGLGLVASFVALIIKVSESFKYANLSIDYYHTSYMTLFGIMAILSYSILAPSILYKKCLNSHYTEYSHTVVWSSFLAFSIVLICMSAHFLGDVEGEKDSSGYSRLSFISVATRDPLGFDIEPDDVILDIDGNKIFLYFNLRYLTQFDGVYYVLRTGSDIQNPMVHILPQEKIYAVSLGGNWEEEDIAFKKSTVAQTSP